LIVEKGLSENEKEKVAAFSFLKITKENFVV